MPKKNTFYQVAKLAQVSTATVSRVAAGKQNVDREIQERVREAAAKLGITLDRKRGEQRRILGFILSNRDVLHPFQARVFAGAEKFAADHGWEMILLTYRYSAKLAAKELELPHILDGRTPVRGVILAGVNSLNLIEALNARQLPFAALGNNLLPSDAAANCDAVFSDDVQGAFDATNYLIHAGHRAIWYIGNTRFPWYARCAQGYQKAMTAAGLPLLKCEIQSDGHALGYLGAKMILSRNQPVTAIFAGTDEVATGVYAALAEARMTIPDDISVVGFNDSEAQHLHPALTSVKEFGEEMGQHLAQLLMVRLSNPNEPRQEFHIPNKLVLRDSVRNLSRAAERGVEAAAHVAGAR